MIKELLVIGGLICITTVGNAQGYVNFNMNTSAGDFAVSAQAFDVNGTTPLAGTGYYAQLYAADGWGSTSLLPKGSAVNFRSGGNAGYVMTSGTVNGNAVDPNVAVSLAPGNVTVQVRAWASSFSSYEAAVQGGGKYGSSVSLNLTSAGGQFLPANLNGLQNFSLVGSAVPEPSTIALGVMGLSVLLFRRRK